MKRRLAIGCACAISLVCLGGWLAIVPTLVLTALATGFGETVAVVGRRKADEDELRRWKLRA
ncbi:hypothetical protein [Sphingomonas sanxanigenens]|uniref:Uncharacterized protein n=1 Tax=Sphingomonas sanxanigenens DSM 19645 = NX02 TaxID=1123269 RepID=W0AFN4_9SPHN|nr:hypothetical protein [Sphingomonas sanxanigenens]AHE55921.1 hypothetical protein NX02_21445 [Sphingomonas sanxanigenens DSM 19645 = NX02]